MVPNSAFPQLRRAPSLSLGLAFAILILFLIAAPFLAEGAVFFLEGCFPKFEDDSVVVDQDKDQTISSSEANSETLSEGTAEPLESSQEDDSIFSPKEVAKQHPLARLLIRSRATPYFGLVVALFFLTVVCLAPLSEEFVFRAVLQGTTQQILGVDEPIPDPDVPSVPISSAELSPDETEQFQSMDKTARRNQRAKVFIAILLPALLFAALHAGVPDDPKNPTPLAELFRSLVCEGLANLATFAVGLALLVGCAGIKLSDLGLPSVASLRETGQFLKSWILGVLLLLVGAPMVLGINAAAERLFPDVIVAPIPIFVFAMYLGFVYYRVRKFATVLGMHMALNFVSFVQLMALVLKSAT